jgi:hypothetical protein
MIFKLTSKRSLSILVLALVSTWGWIAVGWRSGRHIPNEIPIREEIDLPSTTSVHALDSNNTPNNSTLIEPDSLDKEKGRFFAKKNLNWKLLQQGITKPVLFFWIDRLSAQDETKAMEAFIAFSKACSLPYFVGPGEGSQDIATMCSFFSLNQKMASSDFYAMKGVPLIAKICDAVIPRLANEELRDDALKILNRATMDVYEEKDAAWWLADFKNSKFGGFLQGLPKAQWINRPE